jgi:hypothetical protein
MRRRQPKAFSSSAKQGRRLFHYSEEIQTFSPMPLARPLRDLLFVDIATVAEAPALDRLNARMQHAWRAKTFFLSETESADAGASYERYAPLFAEFGKIVSIAVGYFHAMKDREETELRVTSFADAEDEKRLLERFKQICEGFDAQRLRLCAHNGKEFDFPYLSRRMLVHCIPPPEALRLAGKKPWEVPHLDTMDMWMFGNRKYTVSLDLLSALFDLPNSQRSLRGEEVNRVFYEEQDLERIRRYSQENVVVTAQLLMRYRCEPLLDESRIRIVE